MPYAAPIHKPYRVYAPVHKPASASKGKARALKTNSPRWRAIRSTVLASEPLCRICLRADRLTPAKCVDHVDGDAHNNLMDNL